MKPGDKVIVTAPMVVIDPDCYDDIADGALPVAEVETECGHIMPDLYAHKFTVVEGEHIELAGIESISDGRILGARNAKYIAEMFVEDMAGYRVVPLIAYRKAAP